MSSADRDTLAVEDSTDVMRMDFIHHKREHAGFFLRRADKLHPRDRPYGFRGVGEQVSFMLLNLLQPQTVQVFKGGAEADGVSNIRRACFKLVRQPVVNRFFESD